MAANMNNYKKKIPLSQPTLSHADPNMKGPEHIQVFLKF